MNRTMIPEINGAIRKLIGTLQGFKMEGVVKHEPHHDS
jgi:hypothetical protein